MTATEIRKGSAVKSVTKSTALRIRPSSIVDNELKMQAIILMPLHRQERVERRFVARYCNCGRSKEFGL